MYQNVLVTTDGSDSANAVLPHVANVVEVTGEVTVVEVIDEVERVLARFEPMSSGTSNTDLAEQIVSSQRSEADLHLSHARVMLESLGFTKVETAVLEGLPGDRIVEEARRRNCDLVIMSTHGRSGIKRTVLGSVADHVLRHLEGIPMLLLHPAED